MYIEYRLIRTLARDSETISWLAENAGRLYVVKELHGEFAQDLAAEQKTSWMWMPA